MIFSNTLSNLLFVSTALLALTSSTITRYPVDKDPLKCNGFNSLCDLTYDRVSFILPRSSFAVAKPDTDPSLPATQNLTISQQLDAGIRAFQFNAFPPAPGSSGLLQCFPDCTVYNGGQLTDSLNLIYNFLTANTNQIITIFLDNPTKASPLLFQQAFTSSKLIGFALTKVAQAPWPTLRTMINSNKRLVVIEDSSLGLTPDLAWVQANTDTVLQTAVVAPEFTPTNWDCSPYVSRGFRSLLSISHYTSIASTYKNVKIQGLPNNTVASSLNTDLLALHAFACRSTHPYPWVSFLKVDFYNPGIPDNIVLGLNSQYIPGDKEENYIPIFSKRVAPMVNSSTSNYLKSLSLLSIITLAISFI
ncbi:hypothetical protein AYI69_g9213 [Smittium culicis]|uniref:PI-PLC X domain-containing protein n=1 Tax=Smittium culicis TaxID=133412 RepID=A0A1R1XE56_9FUNG|nr:hypothetical protein AYI69_g9213 [Smittium culicis]